MTDEQEKSVLIVDDDDLLRDFYSRVLESGGYRVLSATNGDEAIAIMEDSGDTLVLVIADLLMPIRTGWELIEFMKNNNSYKDIPVIAITGLAKSMEEINKIEACCDAVLQKGNFDIREFMEVINNLTGEKSDTVSTD